MKTRFASGRPAAWRRRFVEIARQLDVAAPAGARAAAFGLRPRPVPALRSRARPAAATA